MNAHQTHRPGQAVFRSILPEEIDRKPFPAFPPPARAVLVGHPSEPRPYAITVNEQMHAALDINLPNYASAIVATNEIVDLISSLQTSGIGAQ